MEARRRDSSATRAPSRVPNESGTECHICGRKCGKRALLAAHLRSHEAGTLTACTYCGIAFRKKHFLQKHIETGGCEEGRRQLAEDLPPVLQREGNPGQFVSNPGTQHLQQQNNQRFKEVTGALPQQESSRGLQKRRHKGFTENNCKQAQEEINEYSREKQHKISREDSLQQSSEEPMKRRHKCCVCNVQLFQSEGDLTSHVRSAHQLYWTRTELRNGVRYVLVEKTKTKEITEYTCSHCTSVYVDRNAFRRHQHEAHPELFPYRCEICTMVFAVQTHLSRHQRVHSQAILKCGVCGAGFIRFGSLLPHVEVVHGMQMLTGCSVCNVVFGELESLVDHEKKEHGVCDEGCGPPADVNAEARAPDTEDAGKNLPSAAGAGFSAPDSVGTVCDTGDAEAGLGGGAGIQHDIGNVSVPLRDAGKPERNRPHVDVNQNSCGGGAVKGTHHQPVGTASDTQTCRICELSFPSNQLLASHELIHMMGNIPQCHLCCATFLSQDHLIRHLWNHSKEQWQPAESL